MRFEAAERHHGANSRDKLQSKEINDPLFLPASELTFVLTILLYNTIVEASSRASSFSTDTARVPKMKLPTPN